MESSYIYIMSNKINGTLYIGVTSNLLTRIWQHKSNLLKGFTQKYKLHKLVYYEEHPDVIVAIKREKVLKNWPRAWKLKLINRSNPDWEDLYNWTLDKFIVSQFSAK